MPPRPYIHTRERILAQKIYILFYLSRTEMSIVDAIFLLELNLFNIDRSPSTEEKVSRGGMPPDLYLRRKKEAPFSPKRAPAVALDNGGRSIEIHREKLVREDDDRFAGIGG